MSNERTSGAFIFLAGLAAGAALGILFAPQSGKETRAKLASKGRAAKDKLDDLIEDGHEQWSELKGKAADAATMTRDEVNDFVRFLFEEGKDLLDRVKEEGEAHASTKRKPR